MTNGTTVHRCRRFDKVGARKCLSSLDGAELKGKRVLVRVDLDVPLNDSNFTEEIRVRAGVSTITHLINNDARVILASHRGWPRESTPEYSLSPLVSMLSRLLGVQVEMANDCIGHEVVELVDKLPERGVLLLENVRFHFKEEMHCNGEFAKKLLPLADLYVNEAFGISHRPYTSTAHVAHYFAHYSKPALAGFNLQKELDFLVGVVATPKKPFAAIVGGAKLSSKFHLIESLLDKVNLLLLGGGLIFTFYKADEYSVGSSLVENDKLDLVRSVRKKAKEKGVTILLPSHVVIANMFSPRAKSKEVPVEPSIIPPGWMGLDIGTKSMKSFGKELDSANTIIWNGPMGVFEYDKFAAGTKAIAEKLAECTKRGAKTIIVGGDTVAAVEKFDLAREMSHISRGGVASLDLLVGKPMPGIHALDDA